jgi:hypothetical protein
MKRFWGQFWGQFDLQIEESRCGSVRIAQSTKAAWLLGKTDICRLVRFGADTFKSDFESAASASSAIPAYPHKTMRKLSRPPNLRRGRLRP